MGDALYLDGRQFIVDQIDTDGVQLRDLGSLYPIWRREHQKDINWLLRHDERNDRYLVGWDGELGIHDDAQVDVPNEDSNRVDHNADALQSMHPMESSTPSNSFKIVDDELGYGGPKAKYRMNVDAIKALKRIESENRPATPEEQETLSHYVGWGALPDVFDETKTTWADEYKELKGLLTDEEYVAARASTLNAHFTSPTVIRAMYRAIENMGFQGGNILEPACGVGNFFGLLPESMHGSRLFGVELDPISGRIAQALYPNADITVAGFETTSRSDAFDLAIGNVPFGDYQVSDRAYNRLGFPIHDYFFAKTIDQVRPGGVIAFVTSRFTLDKVDSTARRYIAARADLLGAIRLPNNAFLANAGTEVVSDIVFLQKRDTPTGAIPDWVETVENEQGFRVNKWFAEHPEMVLGEPSSKSTQYGTDAYTVKPFKDKNLADLLAVAITRIRGDYQSIAFTDFDDALHGVDDRSSMPADPNAENYSYVEVNGELYFREGSVMVRMSMNATATERVKGLIALRDCTRELIDLQLKGATDDEVKTRQARLNELYDRFTAQYGLINNKANAKAFSDDSSYYLLCSLEILNDKGELVRKADMFTERTIKAEAAPESAETAMDALFLSIGECARVDMGYMAELTGKSEAELADELHGVIYRDYTSEGHPYVSADEFLSGNIRRKLWAHDLALSRLDEDSDERKELNNNIEALKEALPKPIPPSEIDVRLGATWVDTRYVKRFVDEVFDLNRYDRRRINVVYTAVTGEWRIEGKRRSELGNVAVKATYGTPRANAYRILEDTLNLRDVRIYDTVENADGKERRVLNRKETTAAQQKQQAIKDAWRSWVWNDPDRRRELASRYNKLFNSVRLRDYDGSHIRFTGMNPEIHMREHQVNAVARILYGGNTLLAREVGAGKTYEMAAAAMEGKRLGLCQKSLFAVPNHLTEQWASEFLRLYPSANILVAKKKDFEKANRKKFCARIATGQWDAVILGHSQLERIPVSRERQARFIQDQITEIEEGIAEVKASRGERFTIKQMEKLRKSLQARLDKLNADDRKDDVVTFEQLGCDRLFVDEAHSYKNLYLYTKMRNVAGLSTSEAQKSSDMLLKCRYMDEITGGRGIVFATGTPVSNSMTELYTMMRYLQSDTLKERGLAHFDSWASIFGETQTAIELAPEGTGYRARTRFNKFHNVPELMGLWKEAADIQTSEDLGLPVPNVEYHNVVAEPTEHQKQMVQELSERASKIHDGNVDPRDDNMLKITSDGRKLGLDQRIINPMLPDDPKSKVNLCVDNILQIYREGADRKLTQLVFCDISTPRTKGAKDDGEISIYDDIKAKLIAGGIAESEIAFIHSANTEARKKELFVSVRAGIVRVLMGSTQKMGAGTNVQDKLIALHDLDCPWRPGDLEQRKGRIVRQGNSNPTVHIYRYVTESTFDAYLWQTVETKQRFISQIMTSKSPVRSCDDIDETALSYAEIKALSAGDPRIKEKMDLDVEVAQLKILKADYESQRFRLQDDLSLHLPEKIANTEAKIASIEKDIGIRDAHSAHADEFAGMTVNGKAYGDKEEAAKAIIAATKSVKDFGEQAIGSYRGFEMMIATNGFTTMLTLKGAGSHTIELGQSSQGNMIRIDNALERLPKQLEEAKERLASLHQQVEASKEELNKPFAREAELVEKNARLIELNALLDMDEPGECVGDDGEDMSLQLYMAPERSFDGEKGAVGIQRNPFTVNEHTGCEPIEANYMPASNESLSQAANRVLGTMSHGYGSGQRSEMVVER